MLLHRVLVSTLLLSGSVAAFTFNGAPSGGKKERTPPAPIKNFAHVLAAGVISAATLLLPLSGPAVAADGPIAGTPLETKLAKFGAVSYPVFNAIQDVTPLADKFLELVDAKVKPEDAAEVAQKTVDGLLAIPDSAVNEYRGVLRQVVYSGVTKDSCVTLGGSGKLLQKVAASPAGRSVDPAKITALKRKFLPANLAVPVKDGNICLPGSVGASEKLWVAQAELTFSMPKAEAGAIVTSIKKASLLLNRGTLASLVPAAEGIFSKNPEALVMAAAGRDVEPQVILAVQKAIK